MDFEIIIFQQPPVRSSPIVETKTKVTKPSFTNIKNEDNTNGEDDLKY